MISAQKKIVTADAGFGSDLFKKASKITFVNKNEIKCTLTTIQAQVSMDDLYVMQ